LLVSINRSIDYLKSLNGKLIVTKFDDCIFEKGITFVGNQLYRDHQFTQNPFAFPFFIEDTSTILTRIAITNSTIDNHLIFQVGGLKGLKFADNLFLAPIFLSNK